MNQAQHHPVAELKPSGKKLIRAPQQQNDRAQRDQPADANPPAEGKPEAGDDGHHPRPQDRHSDFHQDEVRQHHRNQQPSVPALVMPAQSGQQQHKAGQHTQM